MPVNNLKSDKQSIKLEQVDSDVINPATEETLAALPSAFNNEALWLLRRMVKLMESNATVDIANRQKVVVESIPSILGGYTIGGNTANYPTAGAPLNNPSTNYFLQTWAGPVDPRWTNIEIARTNYNTGVRSHLSFT